MRKRRKEKNKQAIGKSGKRSEKKKNRAGCSSNSCSEE